MNHIKVITTSLLYTSILVGCGGGSDGGGESNSQSSGSTDSSGPQKRTDPTAIKIVDSASARSFSYI
ncbi:hypothetical protein [Vibrio sp.]|uniref:hypothetical protein n=1 Tax=Vibrio sp. TaxID=678 RepID=UPI00311FD69A